MFAHQNRPRVLFLDDGHPLPFPGRARVEVTFAPNPIFGGDAPPGQTVSAVGPTRSSWDANVGKATAESTIQMRELEVKAELNGIAVQLLGRTLRLEFDCPSRDELLDTLTAFHYVLPLLMNIEFVDPPVVYSTAGSIGEVPFTWQVASSRGMFDVTTPTIQQERVSRALGRLVDLSDTRPLLAALAYFHRACRLVAAGIGPHEFMGEAILNMAKCLEALFPASEGKTRDAVRAGLADLGIPQPEIDTWFIPAMVLRDQVDVAHIRLASFTVQQLRTLQLFSEVALLHFRDILQRVIAAIENGDLRVPGYGDYGIDADTARSLDRIRRSLEAQGHRWDEDTP